MLSARKRRRLTVSVKLRSQYAVKTASVVCMELEDVLVVVSMCL